MEQIIKVFLQYCSWPLAIILMAYWLIKKLPDLLGALQYKRLVLLSSIKEYSYWLTDLVRRNTTRDDKLDEQGIEAVYNVLAGKLHRHDLMRYDLNNFVKQYKAYCPKLIDVKLTKFNKKAQTISEKQNAIYQYYNDWTSLINTVAVDEYLRSREDLKNLANNIVSICEIIK